MKKVAIWAIVALAYILALRTVLLGLSVGYFLLALLAVFVAGAASEEE